ncbi:unnamed protein product [Paramecium octaurelia]|uniref:Transmembrane protein n=1 Tax=Paramecium octaurelia TaxID=43137 RepID=A0A8S1T2D9_PAROT|nr:unnamed protein product [Paramecium octaurelia]
MKFFNDLKWKFEEKDLEEKYQIDKAKGIKKPVFQCILLLSFCSNVTVLALHFFVQPTETWYINAILTGLTIIQLIFILVLKQLQYIQIGLTFSSITIGILQLNVDPLNTTSSEYYVYGCIFTQFQAVLFMISNLNHAFFQVICSLAIRTSITTFYSKRPDYLSIIVGIFGCFLIVITIFVNDKNSRRYFIQNLKENNLKKLGNFLINKPYLKIQFNEDQQIFQLLSQSRINKFPGYNSELCDGCNSRQILRNYKSDIGWLEQILLSQPQLTKQGCTLIVKCEKIRFIIKVCVIDPQQHQYLILFQEYLQTVVKVLEQEKEQIKLKDFLNQNQIFYHQKVFNLGAFSVLFLNKQVLKKIEFKKLLQKIIRIYQSKFFPNIQIEIQAKEAQIYICSYLHQLRIFLIQIFEIISEITLKDSEKVVVHINQHLNNIEVKLEGLNQQLFKQQYIQNYFIRKIQSLLLESSQFNGNDSTFLLINYPLGTFYQKLSETNY